MIFIWTLKLLSLIYQMDGRIVAAETLELTANYAKSRLVGF
jgi:hypothetical protein